VKEPVYPPSKGLGFVIRFWQRLITAGIAGDEHDSIVGLDRGAIGNHLAVISLFRDAGEGIPGRPGIDMALSEAWAISMPGLR